MKKTFIILLSACMALVMCSCGGNTNDDPSDASSDAAGVNAYIDNSQVASESPDSVTIETGGSVTVSGKIEKTSNGYSLVLESLTTFVISSGSDKKTYPDCTRVLIKDGNVISEADVEGLTVTLSGNLSASNADMYLSDVVIENVTEE